MPVGKVMSDAGAKFDPSAYIPAVAGYYTAPNGQMLSFPFNSSTTVFYYNKDAFKKAGLDPEKAPKTWPEVFAAAKKLKESGHSCPMTLGWQGWTQLESFSAWHNVEFATHQNGLGQDGHKARLKINSPLRQAHRQPGPGSQERRVCVQGPWLYRTGFLCGWRVRHDPDIVRLLR